MLLQLGKKIEQPERPRNALKIMTMAKIDGINAIIPLPDMIIPIDNKSEWDAILTELTILKSSALKQDYLSFALKMDPFMDKDNFTDVLSADASFSVVDFTATYFDSEAEEFQMTVLPDTK